MDSLIIVEEVSKGIDYIFIGEPLISIMLFGIRERGAAGQFQ